MGLNIIFLIITSIFLWLIGFFATTLIITSLDFQIFNLLPILISIILFYYFFKTLKTAKDYKKDIGLKFFNGAKKFIQLRKIELLITLVFIVILIFQNKIPSNVITGMLFTFFNQLNLLSFKLSQFFISNLGFEFFGIISDSFALIIKIFFIYLIVEFVSNILRKMKFKH